MKELYTYLGISKQAVHQMLQRYEQNDQRSQQLIEKAETIRRDHPEMGCRKMAGMIGQPGMGRDKVERLLLGTGFRVIYPPNYTKTTHSVRLHRYKNLVEGLVVQGINKVVQTDITYLWVKDRFYYLVFIIDVYSRLIVGHHASCSLEAQANLKALQMMIRRRGTQNVKGLIHHSDRGSQYHSKEYLKTLRDHKIKISMCDQAWENAYTERINRTIKHEYLRHRDIDCLQSLRAELNRAVRLYNQKRPHWSLWQRMCPQGYEKYVQSLTRSKRPKMIIYKHDQ